ncbi:ABC transporter permease [Candidatus Woesearchaeota archaeon]|nr:ABC transporter permease [Candidatus Woesearchaeota archaeon]
MRKRLTRTLLTMIGIFIGIAAVVSLVSLGQGMKMAINDQFASVGTDKVIVEGASAGFGPPGQGAAGKITKDDVNLIEKQTGIQVAAGRLLLQSTLDYGDSSRLVFVASLPDEPEKRELLIEAGGLKVKEGRMLKSTDSGKMIVGYNIWNKDYFGKPVEIGTKFEINGKDFDIIGLMDKVGAGRDDALIANEDDIRSMVGDKDIYHAIIAKVYEGQDPEEVAERVEKAMRRDRNQKKGMEDFTVSTSGELLDSINTILGVLQAVFIGIAAISLFVGGIGIMNTMYTAVLERTKQIGIMKAIGAKNSSIMTLFIIESGLLGMVGGGIGIAIGIGLSKMVEFAARGAIGDVIQASFPWYLIVGALAFSFIVGTASGLLPAIQASKMQPVEALRA